MKKLIAICSIALAAGAFAADSYLYWMVGGSMTWEGSSVTYDAARVGVKGSDGNTVTYLSLYDVNGTGIGGTGNSISLGNNTSFPLYAYAGIGSGYQTTGYSFFIELLNDTSIVARSTGSSMLDWSALSKYVTTSVGGTSVPSAGAWNGGTFAAIPEPTSGLLVLLGVAGLALRRKRI